MNWIQKSFSKGKAEILNNIHSRLKFSTCNRNIQNNAIKRSRNNSNNYSLNSNKHIINSNLARRNKASLNNIRNSRNTNCNSCTQNSCQNSNVRNHNWNSLSIPIYLILVLQIRADLLWINRNPEIIVLTHTIKIVSKQISSIKKINLIR